MPMPHRTQMEIIKRRLRDKDGSARIRELRAILDELPGYKNGPYADLRKWVHAQMDETRQRTRAVHRDSITVRREGVAQVAVVGAPNAGKSSLLQALSSVQIKTGDYAFTTTRPLPATIRAGGVLVQLVEIPGLIEGASEDKGGGRALLSVLRAADAMVVCHPADAPMSGLFGLLDELRAASIELASVVAITKADEGADALLAELALSLPDTRAIAVSVLDAESLARFREAVWDLTGLVRIFLARDRETDEEPLALEPPVTVADVARAIHNELAASCTGARIWGPSARFDGQRVGRDHPLIDGDTVEVIA